MAGIKRRYFFGKPSEQELKKLKISSHKTFPPPISNSGQIQRHSDDKVIYQGETDFLRFQIFKGRDLRYSRLRTDVALFYFVVRKKSQKSSSVHMMIDCVKIVERVRLITFPMLAFLLAANFSLCFRCLKNCYHT